MSRCVALTAISLAALLLPGCNDFPEVRDGRSIQLIAALRTACSSRNPERLEKCVKAVEQRKAAGEFTDAEYEAFQSIVAKARAGQWQEAEMDTFHFQEAQVR